MDFNWMTTPELFAAGLALDGAQTILEADSDLLTRWTATGALGRPVDWDDPEAIRWSLVGALQKASHEVEPFVLPGGVRCVLPSDHIYNLCAFALRQEIWNPAAATPYPPDPMGNDLLAEWAEYHAEGRYEVLSRLKNLAGEIAGAIAARESEAL